MKTSEKSDHITSLPLISSAEDSRVSRTASQGREKPAEMNAISGERCSVLFAKLSQDGCWQRTYQDCSPLKLDGSLDEFSGTWPASGTMSNGKAYQRPRLVRLTVGIESSLWRTPSATDGTHGGPNARDSRGGLHLTAQVHRWPTPRAFMWKDSTTDRGKSNLGEVVGGLLNPTWVEWLMGFPLGWTDLEASETQLSLKSQSG